MPALRYSRTQQATALDINDHVSGTLALSTRFSLSLSFFDSLADSVTACMLYSWQQIHQHKVESGRHLRGISETIADNSRHLTRGPAIDVRIRLVDRALFSSATVRVCIREWAI